MIQESAFAECTNLSQIHLSDNLEYMYDSAFGYCNSLNNVCIPKTLVECYSKDFFKDEGGPFRDCINLKNISFDYQHTKEIVL